MNDDQAADPGHYGSQLGISGPQLQTWIYRYSVAIGTVALVVLVFSRLHLNPTTVALTFFLIVLGVASRWGLSLATTTAIISTLAFNYFFLPPVRTFTISDPQNWIALFAFLISAIVASHRLSERARAVRPKMLPGGAKRWSVSISSASNCWLRTMSWSY